jgi:ABC-type transport system substrate-binding protein
LSDLPPEISELLQPWQEQEQARAAEDGVLIPGQPGGEMIVRLFGGGGPLEDKRVEDAVLGAVDWPVLIQDIFPNQTPSILVELPEERRRFEKLGPDTALLSEVRAWPYDPERSRSLLAEAGYPDGLSLSLLFPEGDEQLTFTAERMTGHLNELGLEVFLEPAPSDIIQDRGLTTMAAGEPILWLSRQ